MLSPSKWKAENIRKKVVLIMWDHRYKDKAQELKDYAENLNSKEKISIAIWNMIEKL
jgi:UDP:flavonoid glycosyltransferase YjiC (YdhE family)